MEVFRQIEGHLQELENGQNATTRAFGQMRLQMDAVTEQMGLVENRSRSMEEEMRWLRGAFAGIEGALASLQAELNEHRARIEALEKKAS